MEALLRKSLTSGAVVVGSKEDWKVVDGAEPWRVSEEVGEAEGWVEEEAFLPVMVLHSDILIWLETDNLGWV